MMEISDTSLTFAGIFLLGLGLNLTPCVYPMLSVTVSLFRSQKETGGRIHAFLKALVYVMGIAVIYSSLGVATAFTGGLFGAALQSRWVLLGIGFLMAGMAASLFGFYVIQAPQWLIKLASRRGSDLLGVFLSGLFVGVFAAPCIGPLIIALIAFVAQKGDPVFAFRTFFILSMGLGAPYLLLGTFAGLAHKLPKSGVWLVWVDRLFGTILLSVAGFYFILALNPKWIPWLLPASLVIGGIYLGFLEKSSKYTANFIFFKRFFAVLAVIAGVLIPLTAPKQGVVWEPFQPQKLEAALEARKPVVLDFYADWCIPCHELDQVTYKDPQVIQAMEGFVRLKVDLTDPDDPATDELIEKYEVIGVPTILFLDADGKEVTTARQTGYVSPKDFLEILKKVKA